MLSGITIVEFEALGPAPFAGGFFAELGAEVIVIHRADDIRSPAAAPKSPLDRGKKSIALDLKNSDDVRIALDLVCQADALIEGFRPGVMEKLGLGPDVIHARAPHIVYGRMTGWGQTGPLAKTAGHDLNYIARSGALWYSGAVGQTPVTPPTLVGDIGGGALYLVIGILAGLMQARQTGQGMVVDAAIVDGSAHMMGLLMSLQATGNLSQQRGNSLLDGPHWCGTYRCSDGAYITVQCLEPKFYAEFVHLMGLDPDGEYVGQFDAQAWPNLTQDLAGRFALHDQAHWIELFDGTDACVAPVYAPHDAMRDPHIAARGIWSEDQGRVTPAPAPRFSNYCAAPADIPERDGNRAQILQRLSSGRPETNPS
jgi:crotonobetainyl-CoA:carnitine CoA-transferase CaiB-like acyl-CoA transferase